MSGHGKRFGFTTHRTLEDALLFLSSSPVAFMDSQWLEVHLHLLRTEPERVLSFFDSKVAVMVKTLEPGFNGEPVYCPFTGVPLTGGADAPSFVSRRRFLLAKALASPTLGIREQMDFAEMDICKL